MEHYSFNGHEKIGEIVAGFPGASHVLKAYNIDFCCGGNRTLMSAVEAQKLDADVVINQLNAAYEAEQSRQQDGTDWRQAPLAELADYITQRHHGYLREELPVISQFLTKVKHVHGPHQPEMLPKLHQLFHQLKEELEQHIKEEETVHFPAVKAYEQAESVSELERAAAVIAELEDDHNEAGQLLKEMRSLTEDYQLPEWACRTYTLTFQKLEALENDLFEHIHLENNILFPRVRAALQLP